MICILQKHLYVYMCLWKNIMGLVAVSEILVIFYISGFSKVSTIYIIFWIKQ